MCIKLFVFSCTDEEAGDGSDAEPAQEGNSHDEPSVREKSKSKKSKKSRRDKGSDGESGDEDDRRARRDKHRHGTTYPHLSEHIHITVLCFIQSSWSEHGFMDCMNVHTRTHMHAESSEDDEDDLALIREGLGARAADLVKQSKEKVSVHTLCACIGPCFIVNWSWSTEDCE